jgi:hypothetical protein
MRSSRLRIAPVIVPVELWSLPLFRSVKSRHILLIYYFCNNYTLFVIFGYLGIFLSRMCETIDPESYIR